MLYDPFGEFYALIGLLLLVVGISAVIKIWAGVWIATHLFHRTFPAAHASEPEPKAHAADGVKKWISVIAAGLGAVSTAAALLKDCRGDEERRTNSSPSYSQPVVVQPVQPQQGTICCTQMGQCQIIIGAGVMGALCTCTDMLGNVAMGTICR